MAVTMVTDSTGGAPNLIAFPLDEAMATLEELGFECNEIVSTRAAGGDQDHGDDGRELLVVRQQVVAPRAVRLTVARHPGHPEAG